MLYIPLNTIMNQNISVNLQSSTFL